MVGKKLYQLLNELNTAERRLLFNNAKVSNDKRYDMLIRLLGTKGQKIDDFAATLSNIEQVLLTKHLPGKAKNDDLRRFTSFCIKEVEELKVKVFVENDRRLRSYILSNVYKDVEQKGIFEGYLDDLKAALNSGNDYWMNDYYLRSQSALKLRSQTDKDIQEWKAILIEQKKEVDNYLAYKTAVITDKVASLFLDDPNSVIGLGDIFLNEFEIKKVVKKTENNEVKAILIGCLAQLNFENKIKFKKYSDEAITLVGNASGFSTILVKRKLLIVHFLHGFHFGFPVADLYRIINEVILIDKSLKIEDTRNLFFFFLMSILLNEKSPQLMPSKDEYAGYLKEVNSDYFYQFLQAFSFFNEGNYSKCKKALTEISHSKNTYITAWARLLEIVNCVKLANNDLAINYLSNELKRQATGQSKRFSSNSTIKVLLTMANRYSIKVPKKLAAIKTSKQLTPFHAILLNTTK